MPKRSDPLPFAATCFYSLESEIVANVNQIVTEGYYKMRSPDLEAGF